MQSYQNVSNSQQKVALATLLACCKRLCKVIKMLAIHNALSDVKSPASVANAYAKLSKCQQFTTNFNKQKKPKRLQTLLQSYQNVSNSQQAAMDSERLASCKRLCKVIKMLAIHNTKKVIL